MSGLQIKNAGPAVDPNDYVIKSQLQPNALAAPPITAAPQTQAQVSNPPAPAPTAAPEQDYTIVFSIDAPTSGYETPPYIGGKNRDGFFIDIWIAATGVPIDTPTSINFNVNGNPLLTTDIQLPVGSNGPVHSSLLVSPLPVMGLDTRITMFVNTASGVTLLSGGIVVRRR